MNNTQRLQALALASASMLAACGGGGHSSTSAPAGASGLAISGTAATGAAIANRPVTAKCATGTASGTTGADGHYTLTVDGGAWPCLAEVTPASGDPLVTVVAGSGGSASANITPVTHLIVANLAGGDPAGFFSSFGSSAAAAVNTGTVAAAQTAVMATLQAAGIDLSAVGDPITGTLTPASSTSAGNAYDVALDALGSTLSSTGTTLATLTTTVAASSTAATSAGGSNATASAASLPAELLLKPAASNCAALRSGTYRMVFPTVGAPLAEQHGKIVIDATTLAVTYTDGSTGTFAANGNCRFSDDNGKSDIVVSPAGVLVGRVTDDNGAHFHLVIGFPEQSHTLAELAGTWNIIGLERNDAHTGYTGVAGLATQDAAGALSNVSWCQNDTTWAVSGAACTSVTSGLPGLRVNSSDGGFDILDGSNVDGRLFAYRAGSGELLLVEIDPDGSFSLRTRQHANSLPAVGAATVNWNLSTGNQLLSTNSVSANSATIVSVDSAAGSWLRSNQTVGLNDAHDETLLANNPRDGFSFRAAAQALAADNSVVTVREFTSLGLRGMGVNALLLPSQTRFQFSVNQP